MFEQCHCGNELGYFSCCKPFVEGGVPAPTPEALMRSRYTAYVMKNVDYLLATYHSSAPHKPTRETMLRNSEGISWLSLRVIRSEFGHHENEAFVEFEATYRGKSQDLCLAVVSGKVHKMEERSRFLKENDQWFYVDGALPKKIERNAPCICGSGKKYKQCCRT